MQDRNRCSPMALDSQWQMQLVGWHAAVFLILFCLASSSLLTT